MGKRKSDRKPFPRRPRRPPPAVTKKGSSPQQPSGQEVHLRRAGTDGWELVQPKCAREREDDLAEIHTMLAAGESEIAHDELIWLLEECHDYIDAHRLLGELALAADDLPLARGHFGTAWRIGQRAIQRAADPRTVPYALPANQAFHESAKGLVWCLLKLGKADLAAEVVEFQMNCDPSDPLALRQMMASGGGGGDAGGG